MLGIMFQKLLAKKWMFFCLLLGSVLLIATVISFPMYQTAAFDRMLQDEFQNYLAETGEWPAKLLMVDTSMKETGGEALRHREAQMSEIQENWGLVTKESVYFYRLTQWTMESLSGRSDIWPSNLRIATMSQMEDHVELLSGELYSESGRAEDGCIEVLVSQDCMVKSNLLIGEVLECKSLKDKDGSPMHLKIVGVFREAAGDDYWEIGNTTVDTSCMMRDDIFRELFLEENIGMHNISCRYCYLFDYNVLQVSQVDMLKEKLQDEDYRADVCLQLMENFQQKQVRATATLIVLQVPVLVLLGAFLFMVSGQMYELERNEISVIKSRGSSGFQIFRLYLYQSIFLAGVGTLFGIPLGSVFCRILGSASNFLEFGLRRKLEVRLEGRVWWYLAAAASVTILIMTLPAIGHSKVSIVNLKQKRAAKKRSWWEAIFLDVICLGVGLYGYYNYSRNQEKLVQSVLTEQSIDPLLYISSSLFIVGMGLLFIRLQPLLVKLIYLAGQRFWHPASYASFMENLKNGRKQQFIMLFLILTVSLGAFHAAVARTILQNAMKNVEYLDGADIIIKEVWRDNAALVAEDPSVRPRYYEQDFQKYATLEAAESYTKVMYDDPSSNNKVNVYIKIQDYKKKVTFLGIHSREFGENTWVDRELLEEHYYEYLNLLADNPGGILVSRNFQTKLDYNIGRSVTINYESIIGNDETKVNSNWNVNGKIVGYVDYWPGFEPTSTYLDYAGNVVVEDNYLVVANWAAFQKVFGAQIQPYEVWITLKDGADSAEVAQWIDENDLKVEKYIDRKTDLQNTLEDPLLQGTNGILTMGFLVMILLCGVGYLIYWIMSIRSREMIFGVLRAFGMHKRELFQMLMLEQIFSGIMSVLVGIGIGKLASVMFVPMLQMAYAADNQVLPMQLYTNPADMLRLYGALAVVMAACLLVLLVIVFRLNVAKALKLGEE